MRDLRLGLASEVARRLTLAAGVVPSVGKIEPRLVATLLAVDLYNGGAEVLGRPIDSLVVTEVLVQIEEELDVNVFDDDRADEVRTLGDVVELALAKVDPKALDEWIEWAETRP